MKNQTITVTSTEINTKVDIVKDCRLMLTSSGYAARNQSKSSPKRFFFVNSTGEDIEFNFLTELELEEYSVFPERFTGVRVNNAGSFSSWEVFGNEDLEDVAYIKVKGLDNGASANLTIYCLKFV